jgi:integrase
MINTHKRARYQLGSLTTEKRKSGPDVYVFRWREPLSNGGSINRKKIVGTTVEYRNKAAARHAVDGLRLEINSTLASPSTTATIAELIAHYCNTELTEGRSKTLLTRKTYLYHMKEVILPTWGHCRLHQVRSVAVERWLTTLSGAPATKAKKRNIFSTLYRHAMRYEWTTANPIEMVRQSAKRVREPDVLTPEELQLLIAELGEPAKTLVITAAVTGLRCGELIGLRWQDIDFERGTIRIVRSLVDHVEGQPKTEASRKPLPLSPQLSQTLLQWRSVASFAGPENWVFASPASFGKMPYWPGTILVRHIKPAAQRLGITKTIGWHTFRRTYATLLSASGASVTTTMELMRHANPSVTFGLYAQAVTEEKRRAQNALASLVTGRQNEMGHSPSGSVPVPISS